MKEIVTGLVFKGLIEKFDFTPLICQSFLTTKIELETQKQQIHRCKRGEEIGLFAAYN